MSEENKQLLRRWFEEVWNKGRAEAIEEMFAENGIAHGLSDDPSSPITGPSGYRPFYATFRRAFPNIMVVIDDMIAEGDKVSQVDRFNDTDESSQQSTDKYEDQPLKIQAQHLSGSEEQITRNRTA